MILLRRTSIFLLLTSLSILVGCAANKAVHSPAQPQDVRDESLDQSCSYFYFLWGANAEYAQRYEEALEAYEKASICDSSTDYIAEKIPVLLIQLGRFEEASTWLEQYIKNRPEKAAQRCMLARLRIKQNNIDDAIQLYQEALDADSENDTIRLHLGALYSKKKKFKTAESLFKHVLAKQDENAYFAALDLAQLYAQTGKLGLSEQYFLKALEINWSKELAYEIADLYNLRKQYKKAQDILRQILKKHKHDERASLAVVQTYLFLQQEEKALAELTKIRNFTDNPQRIDIAKSQILINLGKQQRAKDILLKLQENDQLAQASYLLGVIYYEELEFEDSLKALKRIPPGSGEYGQGILLQIRILEEQNKSDMSIQLLQESLAQPEARLPIFYSLLGSLYHKNKQVTKAMATLKEGLDFFPKNQSLLYEYALLAEKQGNHNEAIHTMKEILLLNPNHAGSLNFIGYSWADRNINLKKAFEYIRRAIELKPESGYIQDSLGWIYFRLGELSKARVELERAIELEPDDPYIHEHLADTYKALGDKDKSLFHYRKAIELLEDQDRILSVTQKIYDLNNK